MKYELKYKDISLTFDVVSKDSEQVICLREDGLSMKERKSEFELGFFGGVLMSFLILSLTAVICSFFF
jgi:hypothetical protein